MPNIAFVNKNDEIIGAGTREEAWKNGTIHRIVRILIFNSKGEILIQKRSQNMAIWPGKWAESVGGHVDEGEDYATAAKREAQEEMGIENLQLKEIKKYYTEGTRDGGKKVNRFNMLFSATYDGEITFDPYEVSEIRWVSLNELQQLISEVPEDFTATLTECIHQKPNV